MIHFIRNACLVGLPCLLAIAAALHFLGHWHEQENVKNWFESIYIIALTANIGYFTNFIAIKMLFKPHYPTALGRQGLIPKNQPQLAKALANTLSDHFLASDHWQAYLENAQLMPKLVNNSQQYCQKWLDNPQNQIVLQQALQAYLKNNSSSLNTLIANLQSSLVNELTQKIDPQVLLEQSFSWVETQFEQRPREMEFLIEPIVKTIAENIPFIAEKLISTIDEHIENQDTIRRGIAKAAKWSANINEDDIKLYLFRMVASFEFRQTLFEGLQSLVSEYKNRSAEPTDDSPPIDFGKLLNDFINHQTQDFNLSHYLAKKLDDPKLMAILTSALNQILPNLFTWLGQQLEQPSIRQTLIKQLTNLIEQIDLKNLIEEKASQFSPQKMESIFHHMIRDQLVFIELLGALLGGLSGLALININYFAILAALLTSYYLVDLVLTNQRDSKSLQKSKTQNQTSWS